MKQLKAIALWELALECGLEPGMYSKNWDFLRLYTHVWITLAQVM